MTGASSATGGKIQNSQININDKQKQIKTKILSHKISILVKVTSKFERYVLNIHGIKKNCNVICAKKKKKTLMKMLRTF